MNNLLTCFLTFLLFLGPVVLYLLGWPVEGTGNLHLYPSFYILIIYVAIGVYKNKIKGKRLIWALAIVVIVVVFDVLFNVIGKPLPRMVLDNSMALPALYFLLYNSKDLQGGRNRVQVRRVIIIMFIINNLIAIFERLTIMLIFPLDYIDSEVNMMSVMDTHVFRSSALLGHPLSNAIIMSIVMVFVLTSKMKAKNKYPLYFLGMFGLFCFNARAAILLTGLSLSLYYISILFSKNKSITQKAIVVFVASISVVFINYLLISGYGGRFQEQGNLLHDDSALARVEVFKFLVGMDLNDFLWGIKAKKIETLAFLLMGSAHIENWFILSSLQVGLVLTSIVVILFIPIIRYSLRDYKSFTAFLLLIISIGIPSTNNSLACGVPALSVFFACCYAFGNIKVQR